MKLGAIVDDIQAHYAKDIQQAKWVKDEQDRILNEARGEYDKLSSWQAGLNILHLRMILSRRKLRADALVSL